MIFYTMHNSTRKRQSVVCRFPDGRLVLYCKVIVLYVLGSLCTCGSVFDHCLEHCPQGADNVIFERLADGMDDVRKVTREHLEHFGSSGLRTLCLAYKDLNPETYDSWNEKFIQAKSALRDREKKLDEVLYYDFLSIFFTMLEATFS